MIAEGVETDGQLRFLAERGCDEYQGFLVSAPLASVEVPLFLDRLRPDLAAMAGG